MGTGEQLWLRSEILEFGVFPATSNKTGDNIKHWFLDVLDLNALPHCLVAGVTPDGATDGQCGLALIPTIAEKVETCLLHVLQRTVLFSLGIASVASKNLEATRAAPAQAQPRSQNKL